MGPQIASGSLIYNYYAFLYCVVSDEVLPNSSQTIEQIEVIQEVFVPGVSKTNDSALDKKQGDKTQFYPKKDARKRKMDLIMPIIFAISPIDGSSYRVIDSSILQ